MKFDVPLMMPAIHSMRFAASPSRSALMIGMPPPTAPSKATITPFFCAAAKISVPWVASSALLAVTTCLPLRIASSTSSLAMVVPPPTVPMPSSPTLIGFISFQAELKVMLDIRPLVGQDAVHDRIADRAIAPRPVVPDHPVLLRAQRFDRALRTEIEVVGAQAHNLAAQRLEGVREKQQLAGRVHVRALAALRVPGVADLDAVGGRDDVVITGAADDLAALQLAHRPR